MYAYTFKPFIKFAHVRKENSNEIINFSVDLDRKDLYILISLTIILVISGLNGGLLLEYISINSSYIITEVNLKLISNRITDPSAYYDQFPVSLDSIKNIVINPRQF